MPSEKPRLTPEDYVARLSPENREIANTLRKLVRDALPDAREIYQPGWGIITYRVSTPRGTAHTAYIGPRDGRVALGFEYGILLDDPNGFLRGNGSQVRELVFGSMADIPSYPIKEMLIQAAQFARLLKSERDALIDARRRGAF